MRENQISGWSREAQGIVSEHARVMKDNSHHMSKSDITWETLSWSTFANVWDGSE